LRAVSLEEKWRSQERERKTEKERMKEREGGVGDYRGLSGSCHVPRCVAMPPPIFPSSSPSHDFFSSPLLLSRSLHPFCPPAPTPSLLLPHCSEALLCVGRVRCAAE